MHKASGSPVPRRPGRQRHGIAKAGSRFPASGSAGASPGRGKEAAAPGMLYGVPAAAAPRPREPRGLRDPVPRAGPVGAERRAGSRPLGQGGKEGEDPAQKTPRQGRGRRGEAGSELPAPAPQPSFILPEIISFTENICLHY